MNKRTLSKLSLQIHVSSKQNVLHTTELIKQYAHLSLCLLQCIFHLAWQIFLRGQNKGKLFSRFGRKLYTGSTPNCIRQLRCNKNESRVVSSHAVFAQDLQNATYIGNNFSHLKLLFSLHISAIFIIIQMTEIFSTITNRERGKRKNFHQQLPKHYHYNR